MPYIKPAMRRFLDPALNELFQRIAEHPEEDVPGIRNYVITRLLLETTPPRYRHYSQALGDLEAVKQEFYRREIASHEDKRKNESGDVF